jgi:hypothetical protein
MRDGNQIDDLRVEKLSHDVDLSGGRAEFYGHVNQGIRLVKTLVKVALGIFLFLVFVVICTIVLIL